ncbi:MAG: iron-sulfur cluster repair di-iron protein [Holophagales bacterium]|nr:iron-sulfur cluster repair di-iron protein [Holophagales bacterium]
MNVTPESRVGEIAAHHPLATRAFARHGIDFCCGGGIPLAEACARRGVSVDRMIDEIDELLTGAPAEPDAWLDAPLEALVDHIVAAYHRPLREELPRLEAMASKVARVHAERDPEGRLPRIESTVVALSDELRQHMAREEEVLFPALLAGRSDLPFDAFEAEHSAAGEALDRLRDLTENYVPPADACNTWRALWAGLENLESTMHEHVHLENNILFPRAQGAGTPNAT